MDIANIPLNQLPFRLWLIGQCAANPDTQDAVVRADGILAQLREERSVGHTRPAPPPDGDGILDLDALERGGR